MHVMHVIHMSSVPTVVMPEIDFLELALKISVIIYF